MPPRPSRPIAVVLVLLAALVLAAPVAAQSGPSEEREAAEEALAEVQRLADGRGVRTGRELSGALLELATRRADLTRADRQEANELLARPTTPGFAGTGGPYSDSARVLRNCSAHFCVHWVDSSGDAPPLTDADSCPTPDFVDHVRTSLERSHAVENTQLGWTAPVSDGARGGNALTDVYLKELNPSGRGLYGYASVDPSQSTRTQSAFMVLDNDYAASEFPAYEGDPRGYEVPVEVTAAHEYNHVLQYAYDVLQDPWMYESTATWSEEKVFPADDDYHLYMDTWAGRPEEPMTSPDSQRKYGSAIWNHWLERRYGADVVRRAWERSIASGGFAPGAYDLAIEAEPDGTSFEENFGDFTAATAAWEGTNSGIHEGGAFGLDVRRELGSLEPGTVVRTTTVDHAAYKLFDVPVATAGTSPLQLTGTLREGADDGTAGTFALVGIEDDGHVTEVVARTNATGDAEVTMPGDPSRFDRITAVVANADVRFSDFDDEANDWVWTRDAQPATLSLTSVPEPAGDEPLVDTDASTPTTPTTDASCGTTVVEREPVVATSTPTPSTSPTPTPTVTPPPPPPPATSVRLSRSTSRIATAARKGVLALFARTNKAGRLIARATVDAATAKRLKVGRRTTTAGTGRRTATAPARLKINVKLTRKLRAALKRHTERTVRITVRVTFVPADGTRTVVRKLSVLLRP